MGRTLVIVESPAKAKTINKFLGKGYVVRASMGHVCDLPKRNLGVDEDSFEPTYTVLPEKKKTVADLRKVAKTADAVYLAPDPDREGEAICWHLHQVLSEETDAPFHRVLFHEITKKAVREAFEHPLEIDSNKVAAQQARRILDRLVGYKISPLLWDKVRRGLSAGRVQSVALRIICEREREIEAFERKEYWSLRAQLAAGGPPAFNARLVARDGEKIEIVAKNEMVAALTDLGWNVSGQTDGENGGGMTLQVVPGKTPQPFRVVEVQAKEKKKNPAPPFITSKLQQDAARQIGFGVARTMRIAQGLYEGKEIGDAGQVGLITYMRTDSTRVADEAITAVREHIATTYGADALPDKPRQFKVAKQAQEAHEAIRPTSLEYTPNQVKSYLSPDEFKLYTLIWNRFVASQMAPAVFDTTRAEIDAGRYRFRATGSVLKFAGWLAVYHEARDEDAKSRRRADADEPEDDSDDRRLPALAEGDDLDLTGMLPRQHFTQPPPRFTEASLVKELEENGIGRPSTYAQILATITNRDYVEKDGRRFHPTELGFLVNDLMVASFEDIVNPGYTARMEEELDLIEEGKLDWKDALREFQKKFVKDLERARLEMRDVKREAIPTDQVCEKCGKEMVLKWGRFGKFLACSGYPDCKNTRDVAAVLDDDGNRADMPAAAKTAGGQKRVKVEAAPDPVQADAEPCEKCGQPMIMRRGKFGPFLACSAYPDCRNTRRVTINSDGVAEAKPVVLLDETCPKCKSKLAIKQGRYGEFTACSDYPTCRYVKMKETGVTCPKCEKGMVVERRSKRGKLFFGCDRYPDCDFVMWKKPVNRPCPSCDRTYLVERNTRKHGTQVLCDAENCDYLDEAGDDAGAAT